MVKTLTSHLFLLIMTQVLDKTKIKLKKNVHTLKIKQRKADWGRRSKIEETRWKRVNLPHVFSNFFFSIGVMVVVMKAVKLWEKVSFFFFFLAKGTRQGVPKTWRIWVFISEKEYAERYPLMYVWIHAGPDLWTQISDGS